MKLQKKLIAVLLVITAAVSITGCSEKTNISVDEPNTISQSAAVQDEATENESVVTEAEATTENVTEEKELGKSEMSSSPIPSKNEQPTIATATQTKPTKSATTENPIITTTQKPKPIETTPKPKPTETTTKPIPTTTEPQKEFDINYWIEYAKSYAKSKGLKLNPQATECWDNPISAGVNCKNTEADIKSRLNRYSRDEDITDVWIWAEKTSDNHYDLYIGYA